MNKTKTIAVAKKPEIIDRRGPEIAGTRITVYTIMDYYLENLHHSLIALELGLSSQQVLAAIDYIEKQKEVKSYARRTAERLLEYLMDIDAYRGAGRLYLP